MGPTITLVCLFRADFEDLCSDLLNRVKGVLDTALNKSGTVTEEKERDSWCHVLWIPRSGLKLEDIHSVEVVGGSTRIPAIKDIISRVFQREISTTLNLDEAVARGAALQVS